MQGRKLPYVSLFAGIGGLDLGVSRLGAFWESAALKVCFIALAVYWQIRSFAILSTVPAASLVLDYHKNLIQEPNGQWVLDLEDRQNGGHQSDTVGAPTVAYYIERWLFWLPRRNHTPLILFFLYQYSRVPDGSPVVCRWHNNESWPW